MQFKNGRIEEEWLGEGLQGPKSLSPILRYLLNDFEAYTVALYDWEPLLTCLIRTPEENDVLYGGHGTHLGGVHVEGRGADVRIFDESREAVKAAVDWVNARWIYDPARLEMKVALMEGSGAGSSAPHLHLQISEATYLADREPPVVESVP